ncbi:MAG: hypothetical protein Q9226_004765 [Calogaya cf. arnoldii]
MTMAYVSSLRLLLLVLVSDLQQSTALPAQIEDTSSVSEAQGALKFVSGPVITGSFADPSVLKVGNTYYTYATNDKGVRCPAARSSNFKNWTPVANNHVLPELPAWAADGKGESVWGPDVTQIVRPKYFISPSHTHANFSTSQTTNMFCIPQPSQKKTTTIAASAPQPPTIRSAPSKQPANLSSVRPNPETSSPTSSAAQASTTLPLQQDRHATSSTANGYSRPAKSPKLEQWLNKYPPTASRPLVMPFP